MPSLEIEQFIILDWDLSNLNLGSSFMPSQIDSLC